MNDAQNPRFRLSKSKIAAFEHCPKRLWLQIHHRHAAQFDEGTLQRFAFGHAVGEQARIAAGSGILVEAEPNIQAALDHTAQLIAIGPTQRIFEATFQYQDVLIRGDILEPDGTGSWRAIEVKASSRVSSYQLADLSTQVWVMRNAGVSISSAVIRHLSRPPQWWRPDVDAVKFSDEDVSRAIERFIQQRPAVAAAAGAAIRGPEPVRPIGMHCYKPFACEFRSHCAMAAAPEQIGDCRIPAETDK